MPRAPFVRVVQETMLDQSYTKRFRIQADALSALQEATENFLVTMFECKYLLFLYALFVLIFLASNLLAIHAKHITVMQSDIQTLRNVLKH